MLIWATENCNITLDSLAIEFIFLPSCKMRPFKKYNEVEKYMQMNRSDLPFRQFRKKFFLISQNINLTLQYNMQISSEK